MREKILSGIVIFLLAAVPIVLLPFPPTTDVPQHISQLLTAIEHAGDSSGQYVLLWGAPNTLVYGFIYLLERSFSLEFLGRAILLAMIGAWIFAIYYAAARSNRPPEAAVLASLFLFNISFYWGFLNFLIGFPVFVAWFFLSIRKDPHPPVGWYGLVALTSLLLYGSHILWFVVGAAWFGLISLFRRLPIRSLILRAAALVPVCLLTAIWFAKFSAYQSASHLDEAAEWVNRPFEKLFSPWFAHTGLGGGAGVLDVILFIFLCVWMAAGILTNRRELKRKIDPDLLMMAGLLFAICFFAPDTARNTIYFSGRWTAPCLIFLILALPVPRIPAIARRIAAWAPVVAFMTVTTIHWIGYDRNELTGFAESLARVPPAAKVLELDYVKGSRYFKYRPFLQLSAYAQVFHGAELAFPFARHSTGLVAYREPRTVPWTPKLDWYAERVREADLTHFDYILVNGIPYDHDHRLPRRFLTPVTTSGRWRLYRVEKPGGE